MKIERFEYVDGAGIIRGRVDRIESGGKKRFVLYRYDKAKKRFLKGLNNASLPLFRGNEVRAAMQSGKPIIIFLVEGERKANRLHAALQVAGIAAVVTTIAGGAEASLTGEDLAELHGAAIVVVLVDSDDAGRKAGAARSAALVADNPQRTVKVIDLYPNAVEGSAGYKSDVDNWLVEGCTVTQLLALVEIAEPVVPPVVEDGAALLDDILAEYQWVYAPEHYRVTWALFVLHTHAIEAAEYTPYVWVRSPEAGSGKSLVLELTSHMCARPEPVVSVTAATIFRIAHEFNPTLLIDEVDTLYSGPVTESKEAIRSVLNSGFKRGVMIPRCTPNTLKVERFRTFCPKMLAGLDCKIDPTTKSRCIITDIVPPPSDAQVPEYDAYDEEGLDRRNGYHDRSALWAQAKLKVLREKPTFPDCIDRERTSLPRGAASRLRDMWRPLLAIAKQAGGDWPKRASAAIEAFVEAGGSDQLDHSIGIRFLGDLAECFDPIADGDGTIAWPAAEALHTETILDRLSLMVGAPWATWKDDGVRMGAGRIAKMLARYRHTPDADVKAHQIKIDGTNKNGYRKAALAPLFATYMTHIDSTVSTDSTGHAPQWLETLPSARHEPDETLPEAPR